MKGRRLIEALRLTNLLSYGPGADWVSLEPLSVLIGPNASGKSNLIAAISLLRAAAREGGLTEAIRAGGGVTEWLWKGPGERVVASLVVRVAFEKGAGPLGQQMSITSYKQSPALCDEAVGLAS
ncbi:MAG: AAA family ATPase, partial [Phycisphaerae bacterium]